MHTLWIAFVGVALAELGDKTQLLTLVLAARYRKPWRVLASIFVATLVNHALAALAGHWLDSLLTPGVQHWMIGLSLLAMAVWTLMPERIDGEGEVETRYQRHGVFVASALAFFMAEMGDRTQLATLVMGAHFTPYWQVVTGTTLGMLAVNAPTVWLGSRYSHVIPLKLARTLAALLFGGLGLWLLLK